MTRLLAALAIPCALAAADNRYHEDFHQSFPQTSGGTLTVQNFNGSVDVTGWDQNTIDISGTKYADRQEDLAALKIDAVKSGNGVRVRTVGPEGKHGNMGVKYVIRVPRNTTLESIKSSNGFLNVSNVNGKAELRTANGSLHIADVSGSIKAATSNGAINVRLRNASDGTPVSVATSNGSVEVDIDSGSVPALAAATTNGSITLKLPAAARANLHANTSSHNSIHSDFNLNTQARNGSVLDAQINGGGSPVTLTTTNGSISIVKL